VAHSVDGAIGRIRFNKPQSLNALDVEVAKGFAVAAEALTANPDVRVIVVSGEGRAFMAGGDLAYFRDASDKAEATVNLIGPIHETLDLLANARQIVVGSVKGPVAGAGLSFAAGFDLVVAADNTVFNMAYGGIGASPDCGGSWALPRLVGLRKALEIALLCENIPASEALALGLVNRVVPLDELEAETEKLAQKLARSAPVAMANTKKLMRGAFNASYSEQLDKEESSFVECSRTRDFSGAINAFFEKKKYQFEGR